MERASLARGLVLGTLTSLPVMALGDLLSLATGAPFAPFVLFEWMTRWLPGPVVTAGIDLVVAVVGAIGASSTSAGAKLAEMALAIILFVLGSGVLGAMAALLSRRPLFAGLFAGGLWTLALIVAEHALGLLGVVAFFVPAALLLGWGATLGWSFAHPGFPAASAGARESRRRVLRGIAGVSVFGSAALAGITALLRRHRSSEVATTTELTSATPEPPPAQVAGRRIAVVPGTRRELTRNEDFYRIDINLSPPRIDSSKWRLEVGGLVAKRLSLTLDEIRAMPAITQTITLECISNPVGGDLIGTSRWTGVRLKDLLSHARLREGVTAINMKAADGFHESIAMRDALDDRTMLVYAMNGEPLPRDHGFPLRIYIPDRHGMKLPKWLVELEASDRAREGYWVTRGWSKEAIVHTTSVIDVIQSSMMIGDAKTLAVGGIAYAGARGIRKVEVQVDDGPWHEAALVEPTLSMLTWVLWRYDWPYQAGRHTFRVRAYDGDGVLQPVEQRGPRPNGATGIHSRTMQV